MKFAANKADGPLDQSKSDEKMSKTYSLKLNQNISNQQIKSKTLVKTRQNDVKVMFCIATVILFKQEKFK